LQVLYLKCNVKMFYLNFVICFFSLASDILYNKGQMYNPSTGVATVPLSGTYLFSVTIEHWHTQELRCYLRVDGINQVGNVK